MNREKNKNKNNSGFTLMEVIISIAVIVTALVSSVLLISTSISGISYGKSEIVATNLAQEGLEIVRNIRDSNWLAGLTGDEEWLIGLGEGSWQVQYNTLSLISNAGSRLRVDSNNFYQYDTGSLTSFVRIISIEHLSSYEIKITSTVNWSEKGRTRTVEAETRLYNWYNAGL